MTNRFSFGGSGIIGIGIGLLGLAYGAYQAMKIRKTCDRLDVVFDDVDRKTNIDIEETVVEKAVERAVSRKVDQAATEAIKAVRGDIHSEIEKRVRKEVDAQYKDISDEVSEKLSELVADIDVYALKEKVTKKAEEKIVKKFDGALDGLLGDFNRNLGTVSKIYNSINGALAPNGGGSRYRGDNNRIVLDLNGLN